MTKTTVINIKSCTDFDADKNPNDVYIGRHHHTAKYGLLPASKWLNPYKIGMLIEGFTITREQSIAMYRDYIKSNSAKLNQLHELRGKRLGCWCNPEVCHGDVLIELLKEECNT